jgi:8-oxo-dGTP pyrophosphatase MutT (NUDIX family)
MAFGPGLHVFPGGKVDLHDSNGAPDEELAAALGGNVGAAEAAALRRAAIREVEEEIGVRLDDGAVFAPISQFTTPVFMPRRFSTWFFVADLPPDAVPVFAPDEVVDHAWLTPSAAFQRRAKGEIEMWVPTTTTLQRLLEVDARSASHVGERIGFGPVSAPRVAAENEAEIRLAFGGAGGLPGRACETRIVGRRQVVVVDPGDPSEGAIRLIDETVERRGGAIRAILLTAADPDHAAGAEMLAIPHEVPVLVAPGAGRHLPYEVVEVGDGELLPGDAGLRVELDATGPGRLRLSGGGTRPGSGSG